ncbi:MAG: hypothetical protein USCAAHI_02089 [Beijerinckiaceae bacterium]|nr:MAG: hypothetical protein USCAAHI_02089 [Beijerinckiaceae bacterium]
MSPRCFQARGLNLRLAGGLRLTHDVGETCLETILPRESDFIFALVALVYLAHFILDAVPQLLHLGPEIYGRQMVLSVRPRPDCFALRKFEILSAQFDDYFALQSIGHRRVGDVLLHDRINPVERCLCFRGCGAGEDELAVDLGKILIADQPSSTRIDDIVLPLKIQNGALGQGRLGAQFGYPFLQPDACPACGLKFRI